MDTPMTAAPRTAKPPADPLPFNRSLGFLVRDLNRAIQRDLQARLQAHGVPPGAWYFLRVLWEEDGLTQRDLARRVGMTEPTAVIALRGMEAAGWIHRVPSGTDKRKVHLHLTPAGRTLRETLMPTAHAVNSQAASVLSAAEQRTLIALLRRVRESFPP
ncbi:MarR family winged helix-turn-helix transcriptional regulator [Muricoccus radiodurans]|uniref:MarR family winged helix-turn-helix transcriptional regulator n=1 Tax=Muricoccus radiodurans TaxID=2231721 RepID=UPI003CE9FC68